MDDDQEADACTCPEHLFAPTRPPYLKRETQDLGRKPEAIYANIQKAK